MPEALVVESSASPVAGGAGRPLLEPGRLRPVEIIVAWQIPDAPGPTDAHPSAPEPLDPDCAMVVDWQTTGPVFHPTVVP